MKFINKNAILALSFLMMLPFTSNAEVLMPQLEISLTNGGSGATLTPTETGGIFNIDATIATIITSTSTSFGIAPQTFTLNSIFTAPEGFNPATDTANFVGTFTVGGGLLTGEFSNLTFDLLGSGSLFTADLQYNSGSLMGQLEGGTLLGYLNSSDVFTTAKLGAVTVVPVPAAVWLFGSGLLGLVGIARRKTA